MTSDKRPYYVEFAVSGTCGVTVMATSEKEALAAVNWDEVTLNEWEIEDCLGVSEDD